MANVTIEYRDMGGVYFVHLKVDGEPMGIVQRVELRQNKDEVVPVFEIDQIVYTREYLPTMRKLQAIPGLKYTPVFFHADGSGPGATEETGWFMEDQPDYVKHGETAIFTQFPMTGFTRCKTEI